MLDFHQPSEFLTKIRNLYQHMVRTPRVNLSLRGRAEQRHPGIGIQATAQAQGEREQDSAAENGESVPERHVQSSPHFPVEANCTWKRSLCLKATSDGSSPGSMLGAVRSKLSRGAKTPPENPDSPPIRFS
ncbi:hypothetical protein MG293_006792 [Ovis ammon polii]|uniref:Uncharacterized protein n=1 Tax=Ovis ammon polii TaxID=230172 RepID=A0AAD4YDN8_OVIAM|nr:hypothetical protein MG293_006792 [Ovis ammon polii]